MEFVKETVGLLLKPFFTVLQASCKTSKDKVLVNNVKVVIFYHLAKNGVKLLNDNEAHVSLFQWTHIQKFTYVLISIDQEGKK